MVNKLSPISLIAFIFTILVYSKILPVKTYYIDNSIVPSTQINYIEGTIISNPKKISDKYYSCDINITHCMNKNFITSTCSGKIIGLIPTILVESLFPNKLFSKSKSNNILPIEQGAILKSSVKYIKNKKNNISFIFNNIEQIKYNNNFIGKIQKFRAYCRLNFRKIIYNWGKAGGLFLALLSGSTDNLEKDFINLFRNSGLSHILALSGMHLTLISSLGLIIKNNVQQKKTAILFQSILIFLFVWFAGLSPSLLRALIGFILTTLCFLFDIKIKNQINLLSSVFLIHSLISISDLFNIGFILSYGALLGILLFSPSINSYLIRFIPEKISSSLASSISAVIFTSPISLHVFGFISLSGIISTLFASALITLFLYLGIFLFVLCLFIPCFEFFSNFSMNLIYKLIFEIVKIFDFLPQIYI